MTEWLWHLLNDPVDENGWALTLMLVFVALGTAGVTLPVILFEQRRRRVKIFGNRDDENEQAGEGPTQIHVPAERPNDYPDAPQTAAHAVAGRQRAETFSVIQPQGGGVLGAYRADHEVSGGEPVDETPEVRSGDSGVHALPEGSISGMTISCWECGGTGVVTRTTSELLRESIALVPEPAVTIRLFYDRLLVAAPDLAEIFPADLLTTDETRHQRDKLLGALVALANTYNPDDPEAMRKLTTALQAWGRHHAAFARPDGTKRGATMGEYAAVGDLLLAVLADAAGHLWRPEYDAAWFEAYQEASDIMWREQRDYAKANPHLFARLPRA